MKNHAFFLFFLSSSFLYGASDEEALEVSSQEPTQERKALKPDWGCPYEGRGKDCPLRGCCRWLHKGQKGPCEAEKDVARQKKKEDSRLQKRKQEDEERKNFFKWLLGKEMSSHELAFMPEGYRDPKNKILIRYQEHCRKEQEEEKKKKNKPSDSVEGDQQEGSQKGGVEEASS